MSEHDVDVIIAALALSAAFFAVQKAVRLLLRRWSHTWWYRAIIG